MKHTTTDRKETDKIYVSPKMKVPIRRLKIHRCRGCQAEIKRSNVEQNVGVDLFKRKFCSLWCYEDVVYMHLADRLCSTKGCKNMVDYYMGKRKQRSYKKYCQTCIEKRKKVKKEKETGGHTCKMCGTFKKWKEFDKNKYRCKSCSRKAWVKYYYKYHERMKERSKAYYRKKLSTCKKT